MKTLYRPTASSSTPAAEQLTAMSDAVRKLWSQTLPATTQGRQDLLVDLTLLELDVERLHIRLLAKALTGEDSAELTRCASRLEVLEEAWRSARLQPKGESA